MKTSELAASMTATTPGAKSGWETCAGCDWAWKLIGRASGRSGAGAGAEELEQVVGQTDEPPLAADLADPAQPEASEAPHVFDLPEHGLWNCLAPSIHGPACGGLQLGPHSVAHGPLSIAPCRGVAAVWLPIRRDIEIDRGELGRGQIRFAEVPRVRRHLRGQVPQVPGDLFQHRHELPHIPR